LNASRHLTKTHHPKTGHHEPEMQFTELFLIHMPRNFWIPIVKSRKEGENVATKHCGMEMAHHPIAVMQMQIRGNRSQNRPTDTANQEDRNSSQHKEHGGFKRHFAFPHRRHPAKEFHTRGDSHKQRRNHKRNAQRIAHPRNKHMVRPDEVAYKSNPQTRQSNPLIAK
jgi:hypothetical protein